MPVPKRKLAKKKQKIKGFLKRKRDVVQVIKDKKTNTYKRPHVKEKVKI